MEFDLNLEDDKVCKAPRSIFIGITTKSTLNRLLNNGSVSDNEYSKFYLAAHNYFKEALIYINKEFLLNGKVVCHSLSIYVARRSQYSNHNLQFFGGKYEYLSFVKDIEIDKLFYEFLDYQTLHDSDISETLEETKVIDAAVDGKDVDGKDIEFICWYLTLLQFNGTTLKLFKYLPKLAVIVLIIRDSNAELERLFSILRKNKTDSRSKMSCHQLQPSEELLRKAKGVTVKALKK